MLGAVPAQALYCTEFFAARPKISTEAISTPFLRMNTSQRLNVLDQEIASLKAQIVPSPGLWQRLISDQALQTHQRNKEIHAELQQLQKWREMYQFMGPMMEALHRRGFFFENDEIQLLNRVVQSDRLFEAIVFLNQRYKDLPNKSATEKHFLDAVISYLTWGPDFSKDQTPIHHWVIFEIFSARNNPALLAKMTRVLFESADLYMSEKQQPYWQTLSPAEVKVEELWMIQYDQAYKMIEQTSPASVDKVINQAIDTHQLDYDDQAHSFRIK